MPGDFLAAARVIPRDSRRTFACALAAAVLVAATNAHAKTAEELRQDGDRQYAAAQLSEACQSYASAVATAPGEFESLWRLARAESEFGETLKGNGQRLMWAQAVEHARLAIRARPDSSDGHVFLAVALGRQALREGPRTKLAMSREIKSEVDRALELNPGNGRAWHVLAVWNVKIAGLGTLERLAANAVLGGVPAGASNENAERAFQRAIALEPNYVHHRLEYGRLLRDEHRTADARRELEKAVSLAPTSDALDARYQAEARELLSRLPK